MMNLSELSGQGWVEAEPPELSDPETVVARVGGTPIKAGLEISESPIQSDSSVIHRRFRTGPYDMDVKIESLPGYIQGQVKVEEVDDY